MPEILGILNLTTDSFSDGGRFLEPAAAIAHGEALVVDGADWLDLGAESSNPDGTRVDAATEIARLGPVLDHFVSRGVRCSVDTHKTEVMRAVLDRGAGMINDITGFADPAARTLLAAYPQARLLVMYARNHGPRAENTERSADGIIEEITTALGARLEELIDAGIAADRVWLDPGMGLFLGNTPAPSLQVLRHLTHLTELGRPLCLAVSRKSFIGHVLGGRPAAERAAGTLAAELWAAAHGAEMIRTHEPAAFRDAWNVWQSIAGAP